MIKAYAQYKVEKVNRKFTLEEGLVLSQTAIVSLFDKRGKKIRTLELGIVDFSEFFLSIVKEEPIHLDACYIENFSLSAFRKQKGIKKNQAVSIPSLKITNSFLSASETIDFSYTKSTPAGIDFSNSIFWAQALNFSHCRWSNVQFENVSFYSEAINFKQSSFGKGDLSFKMATFCYYPSTARKNLQINFERASFGEGRLDFTRSHFQNASLLFSNAQLSGREVLFVGAEFQKVRLNFKALTLNKGSLDFHFANFEQGDLIFDRATFGKASLDFSGTEFQRGKINFNRTELNNMDLVFESMEMNKGKILFRQNLFNYGSINFESADLSAAEVLFDNVDFGRVTATFFKARVYQLSFLACHLNAYFNLQVRSCQYMDLSGTVVRDIVDIKSYRFKPEIKILKLSGLLLVGHIYLDWKTNNVKDLILNQEKSHRNKSEQFRILKENYHSLGQYNAEDEAYVAFKRSEAKADLEEVRKSGSVFQKVISYLEHGLKWLVFDKIGLYATSPGRVLLSMVFTYLFFVLLYFALPLFFQTDLLPSFDRPEELNHLGKALYHSIVTFLTIGYGDYYPSGIIRWISGFEGFMGLFLISYFTVAFVRKVLR